MTVSLLPSARVQFCDLNGAPLVGGTVETYIPGTLTLKDTYQDSLGTILNTHPIALDATGTAAIWGNGSYRQVVTDALGNLIWDQVTTAPASGVGSLLAANDLSDLVNAGAAGQNLLLGSAAYDASGTSGHVLPFLDGNNTSSGVNTHTGLETFSGGANLTPAPSPAATAVGYLGVPQKFLTTNYILGAADLGTEIFFGATATATIPNASLPIGAIFDLAVDQTFTLTLVPSAGVVLRWPQGNVTTNRTVTGPGAITIKQEKTNEWWVRGGANIS